jgi:hypothetical protein
MNVAENAVPALPRLKELRSYFLIGAAPARAVIVGASCERNADVAVRGADTHRFWLIETSGSKLRYSRSQ